MAARRRSTEESAKQAITPVKRSLRVCTLLKPRTLHTVVETMAVHAERSHRQRRWTYSGPVPGL